VAFHGLAASPKGSVRLEVHDQAEWVGFTVRDTGIGLDEKDMETVFEPFVQVERGYGRRVSGTGLGLSISRHLVELLGGDLRVSSMPGEGSIFTVWVPRDVDAGASRRPADEA
jgi:signal transduction histidine kinase